MMRIGQWMGALPALSLAALGVAACATAVPERVDARVNYQQPDYATAPLDLSTPQATAYSMMIAMYRGDAEMVDAVFLPDGQLRLATRDGEAHPDNLKGWRDWVGTLEVGAIYEDIFALEVEQFGNLATVWAPFVLTDAGGIQGCGVNQLSLARVEDDWRVAFAMYTSAEDSACGGFKSGYAVGR